MINMILMEMFIKMDQIRCKRCNRVLKNPISVERQYGAVCFSIINSNTPKRQNFESFQKDIDFLKLEIQTIKRMIRNNNGLGHQDISIERIVKSQDVSSNPQLNEYRLAFQECVNELREVLKVRKEYIESQDLTQPPHIIITN